MVAIALSRLIILSPNFQGPGWSVFAYGSTTLREPAESGPSIACSDTRLHLAITAVNSTRAAELIREQTGRHCSRQNLEQLVGRGTISRSVVQRSPIRLDPALVVAEFLSNVDPAQTIRFPPKLREDDDPSPPECSSLDSAQARRAARLDLPILRRYTTETIGVPCKL